jgi:hypothetical protein
LLYSACTVAYIVAAPSKALVSARLRRACKQLLRHARLKQVAKVRAEDPGEGIGVGRGQVESSEEENKALGTHNRAKPESQFMREQVPVKNLKVVRL